MHTIIKSIRSHLNMSQTEFAELLGVTFATVNRWENGRAKPNKLAQTKIYDICRERTVPLYQMVLDKIERVTAEIEVEEGHILLYHGSKNGIDGAIALRSREHCDFGKGFYMGTDPSQCLTLICDFPDSRFYVMSVNLNDLQSIEIPVGIDWAMLVAYNRDKMQNIQGTKLYRKYGGMTKECDLVIGCIADDRMFFVIDSFFQGTITDAALIHSLSALNMGKQYVMVTRKGCAHTKIAAEVALSDLERMSIQEVAVDNRNKGVSFANEICRNYRREGKYFDELLEETEG